MKSVAFELKSKRASVLSTSHDPGETKTRRVSSGISWNPAGYCQGDAIKNKLIMDLASWFTLDSGWLAWSILWKLTLLLVSKNAIWDAYWDENILRIRQRSVECSPSFDISWGDIDLNSCRLLCRLWRIWPGLRSPSVTFKLDLHNGNLRRICVGYSSYIRKFMNSVFYSLAMLRAQGHSFACHRGIENSFFIQSKL